MTAPRLPAVTPTGAWVFTGRVVKVVDGDTVDVELNVDTGHDETLTRQRRIRIIGIDAPEASSPEGRTARDYATGVWAGLPVTVTVVGYDKYGGRDDGHVTDPTGTLDWASDMLAAGHAKPYGGGRR
jgi:endonuclease YncB( thermonuclease family)